MSTSTFLELQQDLASQVGLDQTVSSQATLLKRWINKSQQQILRTFEWPFNRASVPLVIQTTVDYTTGTVATVLGSTTITFSATITASKTGQYIQTSSSLDWYKITAHTAGTATAAIEIAALVTATAATYTIRKFYYSTNSSVDRIIQINQSILPYQLEETSPEYFQSFNPGFLASGTPRIYMPAGLDTNGYPQFRLWPNPDAAVNLYIDYLKVGTNMTLDADTTVIPEKWATSVLITGAKVEAFSFLDDSQLDSQRVKFTLELEEMKTEYETSLHRHRVMTAADNQPVGGSMGYLPLPFTYPRGS